MTLYDKALNTVLHSRFVCVADDKGRTLTDAEVKERAKDLLENVPYMGYDKEFTTTAKRQLKALLK